MNRDKILIIDDEIENLSILKVRLESSDFDVVTADNPRFGINLAKKENPDLILLDLNMPEMDGYEVCKHLKNDFVTSNIPIIMLTCMDSLDHKLNGLEGGADDYLVKDKIEYREIAARVRSHLRRNRTNMSASPLTKLPGNVAIERKAKEIIANKEPFVLGYLDIDNFKAYNDYYSFEQGDKIIQFIAKSLVKVVRKLGRQGDFVGHIGGDDFVFITVPEKAEEIADATVRWIDKVAPQLYNEHDRENGCITAKDREGNLKKFGFIGVTIALVEYNPDYTLLSEYSEDASRIKKMLKNEGGSRYATSQILKR
ncbi:MAG: response regulator [Candidatus Zixiibacteriota bacterium]